ncbi:RNA recognition domain-containing protein [Colletotrichum tofieldiae]|uniref:RNA recognition domain-containing protein n=1 Tax=Colletotrichum tofieldiae TaxID=708197 RepID=A0A166UU59_9PEZI|nr:RNA recognition domain-containing protein [Colletotrichum tofieldiae]GKT62099.1 RNA recognition domain-containing protein [Colletotrichum tofieldiae]GKT69852.1 RNA recognition domain-containing protein [Colletotrichum tofieldiae]GKT92870.1 RNA recognition domain-containing protein [Colletotrichum tofieldiae]
MFLAAEDTPLLRAWLMNKLPDVSDTETDILADYVLALLASQEGDAAHIRAACESELPQFLNTDAAPEFVDELFDVIEYKSFLPGAPPPPKKRSEPTLPSPVAPSTTALQSGSRKRSYNERGDVGASGEREFAFGDERAYKQPRRGQWDSRMPGPRGHGSPNGYPRQPYAPDGSQQPPTATAQYDPNFPQPPAGPQDWRGLPQMPAYPQGVPYGPPQGPRRNRQKCRDFATKGYCSRGNSCQYDHGIEPIWLPPSGPSGPPKFEDFDPRDAAMMMSQNFQQMQQLMEAFNAERGSRDGRKNRRGAKGRRRHNRASFSAEGPVDDRTKTTIVVENIPEEFFSEEEVRRFFSEFGNIEQVILQPYKRLATVKYDTWDAANAAYRSPKVIFDNRFVRVFWFVDPSEQAAARAANASGEDQEPEIDLEEFMKKQEEAQRQHEEKMQKKAELDKQRHELEQRQRELLAQHREVQQKLQAKLASKSGDIESAEDGSLNSALRAQLAALEDEAKLLGLDPSATDEPTTWHASTRGRGRGRGGFVPRGRGFAPRGRGSYRGGYRGDVHAAYAAYSLDNRPKTVSVTGVDFTSSEKDEVLRQYLLGVGEFTDIHTTPSETEVTFKDRKTAEKFFYGLPKQEIPGIDGQLELSWVSRPLPPAKTNESVVSKRQGAPDHDMAMGNAAPNGSSAITIDQQPEQQPEMDYDVADDDEWGVE